MREIERTYTKLFSENYLVIYIILSFSFFLKLKNFE